MKGKHVKLTPETFKEFHAGSDSVKCVVSSRNLVASELVRAEVKFREEQTMSPIWKTWRYIDFVDEDRFLNEIETDKGVSDSMDAEELADYAIKQIYS